LVQRVEKIRMFLIGDRTHSITKSTSQIKFNTTLRAPFRLKNYVRRCKLIKIRPTARRNGCLHYLHQHVRQSCAHA
jgi:hypothetical protein